MRPFDYASSFMLQTVESTTHYVLVAAFAALGTLVTIIGYLIKKRMEVYDKHLEECRERAVSTGRMEERLIHMNDRIDWMGEFVSKIGDKLGVTSPPPQSRK